MGCMFASGANPLDDVGASCGRLILMLGTLCIKYNGGGWIEVA